MKKSSKRTLSRFLAGVMIVTSVFGSTYVSAAETVDTADATAAVEESITSDAAVDIEQYADEDIPAAAGVEAVRRLRSARAKFGVRVLGGPGAV